MPSIFSEPDTLPEFAKAFDLVGNRLSPDLLTNITTEALLAWSREPDNRALVLALDALALAEGNADASYEALTNDPRIEESSVFRIRRARQHTISGEAGEARELLDEVIRADTADNLIRQLAACTAHGRLDDREAFSRCWQAVLEQEDLADPVPFRDLIAAPDDYTLLSNLPFREHSEMIRYLFRYDIPDHRDAEVLALADEMVSILDNLERVVTDSVIETGSSGVLPGVEALLAMTGGGTDLIEEILAEHGTGIDPAIREAIDSALGDVREIGVRMQVLAPLLAWASDPETPPGALVATLRDRAGGDDRIIRQMLDLVLDDLSTDTISGIGDVLAADLPPRERALQQFTLLVDAGRFADALAVAEEHDLLDDIGNEPPFDSYRLSVLRQSDRLAEAFALLLGWNRAGRLLHESGQLVDLALILGRMDTVLALRPVFTNTRMCPAAHLIPAYDCILKKDVKGAMQYLKRAEGAGLSREQVLVLQARILLAGGFPKRVVSLRGKMEKILPPATSYPVLIRAYRELGREAEAAEAEALLRGSREEAGTDTGHPR
ncbi:MAG: hypothetical protein WC382_05565 [Methanoregulaceae archaeon]|jgi:hypothetical protein